MYKGSTNQKAGESMGNRGKTQKIKAFGKGKRSEKCYRYAVKTVKILPMNAKHPFTYK